MLVPVQFQFTYKMLATGRPPSSHALAAVRAQKRNAKRSLNNQYTIFFRYKFCALFCELLLLFFFFFFLFVVLVLCKVFIVREA